MTEKDYAPQKSESKKMIVSAPKETMDLAPVEKEKPKETIEPKGENVEKEKPKKPIVKNPIKKKTEAVVNAKGLHISTKHSMAICKFIKKKKINDCIEYLENVITKKKAMPMRGEIPHRKGKMMSGRFPKNASENFIKLLKSLGANARENDLDDVVITEAIANLAPRPRGKFGRVQKKRTHVTLKCKEQKIVKKVKEKKK